MSTAFSMSSIAGQTVRDLIDSRAAKTPNRIFLIDPTARQTVTFRDLRDAARSVAAQLRAEGCEPGDRIAYAMENGADAVRVLLGAMYVGFVATAINLVSGPSTISYVLDHSEARIVFVDDDTAELVAQAAADIAKPPRAVPISQAWFAGDGGELPSIKPDTDSMLMYTSGTTGKPKGVVHTHASILAGGGNTALAHELTHKDRALCVLPAYHINSLCVTIMGPLVSGSSVLMPRKFSVSSFWNQLRDHACTWFSVVPTQISYLLHHTEKLADMPSLRFGRSASSPLSPDVQSTFEAKFDVPIVETMGLTETAAQILSNPLPPGNRKIGSPGIAYGNEVLVADPDQNEVPRGEEGEIIVRGANVMRIYRNNDEATSASLTAEGWLRTGDLGRMDDEGYVFITCLLYTSPSPRDRG